MGMTEGVFGRLGVGVIVWGLGDWSDRVRRGPTVGSRMPGWGRAGNPSGGILCHWLCSLSCPTVVIGHPLRDGPGAADDATLLRSTPLPGWIPAKDLRE